ncbi:4Fe-4S dicluster domain-containing protein [Candidatus Thorarchaeota archaeon]|nr:MAG: 4Fe-4S dicluster domain-containing protein [Candidatus Thorarchaeota archaeon]
MCGRMKTEILVDHETCGDPRECKKCLQICPGALFMMYSPDDQSNDPQDWRVDVAFTDLCTRCGDCVEVCPKGAIKIL